MKTEILVYRNGAPFLDDKIYQVPTLALLSLDTQFIVAGKTWPTILPLPIS